MQAIIVRGTAEEIAALALALQERQDGHSGKSYVKDFSEGESTWGV